MPRGRWTKSGFFYNDLVWDLAEGVHKRMTEATEKDPKQFIDEDGDIVIDGEVYEKYLNEAIYELDEDEREHVLCNFEMYNGNVSDAISEDNPNFYRILEDKVKELTKAAA